MNRKFLTTLFKEQWLKKTMLAQKARGAYKLSQESLSGKYILFNKVRYIHSYIYSHLFIFSFPLTVPHSPLWLEVLWTLPREKLPGLKGEECNIYSSVWYLGNIRPAGVSAGMPFIPQHINALFRASSKQQFRLDFEAQVCLVFFNKLQTIFTTKLKEKNLKPHQSPDFKSC